MKGRRYSYCLYLILIQTLASYVPSLAAPEGSLITQIPGFSGNFPSRHYAGYVTIDENHGKKLYYYFVESERNPWEDPVVLWLNGGPGCSSFDGFVYEHGPFNFEAGKPHGSLPTLHRNPYSWSKVSSILYLDSPSGVGLSYSENISDYITGDLKSASDSHIFLLKWFELYPEFISNPFFISGESYAGIYVPTLAYEVAKGIDAGIKPILHLKGYMVGNGVTDDVIDGNALVPFVHGMGLISEELFEEVTIQCNGNYYNSTADSCQKKLAIVDEEIKDINVYNILEPCYHATPSKISFTKTKLPQSFRRLGVTERPLPVRKRMFGRAWPLRAPVRDGLVPSWPQLLSEEDVPCTDDEVATAWLNSEAVRRAIHAEPKTVAGNFELCTDRLKFYHDAGSMIKYHKNLTSRGYRALIYSGDHDMCVPFTGSEALTRSVGYKKADSWRPWFVNDQVAGYIQVYENNLIFLTIKEIFCVQYFEMFHRQIFTRFAQQRGEPFYAAWERFNYLANNFLYHDFSNYSLLKFFLNGLDAVTRRWVIDGALTTGSPLFCRDDEEKILLLGDMADFDYHRYWGLSPQCWSHQYTQDHYPEFIDQPFEFQNDERDSHELITTQLEDTVNKYVALTEAAMENKINSLRNLEEQIENIKKLIFQSRREHEVKRDTQPVIDPVWFDDDDSNNQDSENDVDKTENLELFEPSLVCEPQSEEIFEEFSDKGVPTLFFSSHADYSELCVVELTSLMCLYLARIEGIWNPDPDVVSYDTYFGHQPLFDKGLLRVKPTTRNQALLGRQPKRYIF